MTNGLAVAQAQYDAMEPPSFSAADEDRIDVLAEKGTVAILKTVRDTVGDLLDDVWDAEDSDVIRDAVTQIVLDQVGEALK